MMDWDKLRIFHAVAEAGSFTHAGEQLDLSQSAVSRQISALEESLGVLLFHRHARGLMLTEPGDLLHKASRDIQARLTMTEAMLTESRETPKGPLTITTTLAIGTLWLAPKVRFFRELYPDIQLRLLINDEELDLAMREADVAIRLTSPRQPDLVQRHLTSIHFHLYASREYLNRHKTPEDPDELKNHTLITYPRDMRAPFSSASWLLDFIKAENAEQSNIVLINNMLAIMSAVESNLGIAVLPDFLTVDRPNLVRVLPSISAPQVDARFVYPEELRNSKRITVFRDFLLKAVQKTPF